MSIDMRYCDHEENPAKDFSQLISLVFVAVMMFVLARPSPVTPSQISFYLPTCVGMFADPNTPREAINITVDFDDTLLWNDAIVSQAHFEKNLRDLRMNHNYTFFVLNINPLASNKSTFDTMQKMQKYQKEFVILTNSFTLQ